jgi:hypothetical protein
MFTFTGPKREVIEKAKELLDSFAGEVDDILILRRLPRGDWALIKVDMRFKKSKYKGY